MHIHFRCFTPSVGSQKERLNYPMVLCPGTRYDFFNYSVVPRKAITTDFLGRASWLFLGIGHLATVVWRRRRHHTVLWEAATHCWSIHLADALAVLTASAV